MGRCRSARSIAETSLASCFMSLTWMLFNMLFVATRSHPFLISLRTAAAVARFHAAHNEKMAHLRQGDSSFLAPHLRQRFSSLGAARTGDRVLFLSAERRPWVPLCTVIICDYFEKSTFCEHFFCQLLPVTASYGQLRPVTASCSRFRTKGRGLAAPPFVIFSATASCSDPSRCTLC